MSLFAVKLILLLFWALWISLVFLTNLFEGLKVLGLLKPDWRFASENYTAIARATSIYSLPGWANRLLFYGVLVWQAAAVVLFWAALLPSWLDGAFAAGRLNLAFTAALGLWAGFMLANEIFRNYEAQSTHLLIFTAQLATLVVIYVLP